MSNLAYDRLPEYEEVKQVFLDKGFPEAVVQYVLLRNSNYNYESLQTRMTVLEKQMVTLSKDIKEGTDKLGARIDKLDTKIESVRSELRGDIGKLDSKIESVRSELRGDIEKLRADIKSDIKAAIYPIYWILGVGVPAAVVLLSYFK
ncbi:Bdr family repetitive protein [Borrelia sp. RT5S]|uniref:Bdr family repetitive protein n=1 Tax=Borrelia sp. RT5S TaxID=2898581 RepID=UPI001E35D38F|nr:Bdr family repetitive protein [Borrelia sp. RT5S]UGQ16635.1 Bdr family repetitive protein [Borrelia sp. RT5S]